MLLSLHLTTFKLYCSGILTSCFCFYSDFNTYWTTRNFDRNQSSFKFLWLSQEIKCYAAKVFLNRELISKTRTFYWGKVYHNLVSFFVQSFDVPLSPIYPSNAVKGQLLRSIPNLYSISVLIGSDFYTLGSVNSPDKEGKSC